MSGYTDLNNYELKSKNGLAIHHRHHQYAKMTSNDTIDGCANKRPVSFLGNGNGLDDNNAPATTPTTTTPKTENAKSFVEQRIERLYGRGLLLDDFHRFKRRSSSSSPKVHVAAATATATTTTTTSSPASENNFAGAAGPAPSLPVFKHLSPEFRAQLVGQRERRPRNALLEKDSNILANGNGYVNGSIAAAKMSKEPDPAKSVEKGPHYFLALVGSETERLLKMAADYEHVLNDAELVESMSEDTSGAIRAAVGQARLFTSQKMEQFRGLCKIQLAERKVGETPLESNDLAGFWDWIALEVAKVDAQFNQLRAIKNNNWVYMELPEKKKNGENGKVTKSAAAATSKPKPTSTTASKATSTKAKTATTASTDAATRKKNLEEQREKFRAFRQQKRAAIVDTADPNSSGDHGDNLKK